MCETGPVAGTAEIFRQTQSTIGHTPDKTWRKIVPSKKSIAMLSCVQKFLAGTQGLVSPEDYGVPVNIVPLCIAISTPALLNDIKH